MDAKQELLRILSSPQFRSVERGKDKIDHLAHAIKQVNVDGLWLEFGVSTGESIKVITAETQAMVFGFDTFEGLPEDWVLRNNCSEGLPEDWVLGDNFKTWTRGSFRGEPNFTRNNMTLVKGQFADTLPLFLDNHPGPIAFAHIDCDLYSSTRSVLRGLKDRLVAGTVIVFDELFNYPNYAEHEMRAWLELVSAIDVEYVYIGHVPSRSAASLKITRIDTIPGSAVELDEMIARPPRFGHQASLNQMMVKRQIQRLAKLVKALLAE
jgi:hypothetical protein